MPNKSTPESRILDAYFLDEYSVQNTASNTSSVSPYAGLIVNVNNRIGLFKNIFTRVSTSGNSVQEEFQSKLFDLENRADPKFNNAINIHSKSYVRNPIEAGFEGQLIHKGEFGFSCYFSDQILNYWQNLKGRVWETTRKINLTLLFGPRNILNRSGVRSFFKNTNNFNAIIQIPGIEPEYFTNSAGKLNKDRWGVSLTDSDIANLFKSFFNVDVPFQTVVLAAYSTGANGLNQTILNDIINLSGVKRLIFFDCLYEYSSGSTIEALKKIKRINSNIQIIIYWASQSKGTNTVVDSKFKKLVVVENAKSILSYSQNVIDFGVKYPASKYYRCLVCSRVIEAGIKDGLLQLSPNAKQAFSNLQRILPKRGTIISNASIFKHYVNSKISPNHEIFDKWYQSNANILDGFYRFIDSKDGNVPPLISQIDTNKLMGYSPSIGSETHDLLIPEFGWEYLPFV